MNCRFSAVPELHCKDWTNKVGVASACEDVYERIRRFWSYFSYAVIYITRKSIH